MSEMSKDCLLCRLMSGGGLILIGGYLFNCAKTVNKFGKYNRPILYGLGTGLGLLGILRVFDLPPFKHLETKNTDLLEDSEEKYIVEKFPTKFNYTE